MEVSDVWKTRWRSAQDHAVRSPDDHDPRYHQARPARTEADMARRPIAAMLLIALLALPALGAQKTVLYEHYTASW